MSDEKPKQDKPKVSLADIAKRARVLSVCGPFNSRAIIEMPTEVAEAVFPQPLSQSGSTDLIDAIHSDLDALREVAPELADSALAASALAMAREIANPYASATAKSNCARIVLDTMDRLRELAPPDEDHDELDELRDRRAARRGGATAKA